MLFRSTDGGDFAVDRVRKQVRTSTTTSSAASSFALNQQGTYSLANGNFQVLGVTFPLAAQQPHALSTGGNVSAGGAGDMPSDIAEYVIYDSNKRYLSESDLAGYTDRELWLARNEIYARHGRGFNNSELQNYFNSKSWYTKKYEASSFPDSLLNEYEKKNADTILKVEKKRGSSYVK